LLLKGKGGDMHIKDWWLKLSPPNKRSGPLFWVVVLLLLSPLWVVIAGKYAVLPLKAVIVVILFGAPFYLAWKSYRAFMRTKESPNYKRARFVSGLVIMCLLAFVWTGALIIMFTGSGVERPPLGILLIPMLILAAVGEWLAKSAFNSTT
jgi:hypothetical protein